MEELNYSIVENLRNNNYFVHAKEWYVAKYIQPFADRTYVIITLIVTFVSFVILFLANQTISSGTIDFQYVSYTNQITDKYAKISQLGQKNEDPQIALETYLCKLYVKNREQYNYDNIATQTLFIKNNSSEKITKLFLDSISINNPDSPIVLYQDNLINQVEIVSAHQCPREANCMNVIFTLHSKVKGNNEVEKTNWLTKVIYNIDQIENLISNNSTKVNFMVSDYEIKKLR